MTNQAKRSLLTQSPNPSAQFAEKSKNEVSLKVANKPELFNKYDRETLLAKVMAEPFKRITVSFYRYVHQKDLDQLRDSLYQTWNSLGVLGRVYIANEGINAQISIPEHNYAEFTRIMLEQYPEMPVKTALEEEISFIKLILRIRKKILADGMDDNSYDVTDVGQHITAKEFNQAMDEESTIVIDVRNHYESEIGHFKGALKPDVDSFREELPVIKDMLKGKEHSKILLYCTGGIRCEKTSAWLKHEGFKNVNQLHGGIIDYARQIKREKLDNKFIGKNFVFDGRMEESISDEVIASCHQCGKPADHHRNCNWQVCHILFIQCQECDDKMEGCCSPECLENTHLPTEEQTRLRKTSPVKTEGFFNSRRRPNQSVRCS
jgi:UPF0176 protein